MSGEVIISFGANRDYEVRLLEPDLAGSDAQKAREWFDQEWTTLECEPTHPMGKVLLLDKILGVAKYGGEKRFAEAGDWAKAFARNAVLVLGRPAVRVDVSQNRVG